MEIFTDDAIENFGFLEVIETSNEVAVEEMWQMQVQE